MSPPLTHADAFARLDLRLRDLRTRAQRGPLSSPQLVQLEHTATELHAMLPQLRRYVAALEESRGLALEEQRGLLARVEALALDAPMTAVTELRRAGRVRAAIRVYLEFLRRAPHDDGFGDRLAGLSLLLEEFAVHPAAGMTRALARALVPGWWRDPEATIPVVQTLRYLPVDWDRLPA